MIKLKERRVELTATLKNTKMLTMKMDDLGDDAGMTVQAVRYKILQKDELKAAAN